PQILEAYSIDDINSGKALLQAMLHDQQKGRGTEQIAFRFHNSLPKIIRQQAQTAKAKHLCFSGGVFQNALLVDLVYDQLGADFQLYFHKQLSPNDENIAFGQLILHLLETNKLSSYVFGDPRKNSIHRA
ncbi:MAG: hypothetical protein AAFP02_07495, partial [Bacteroidota bacterium]